MKTKMLLIFWLAIDAFLMVTSITLLIAGIVNHLEYSLYVGALMAIYSVWMGWKAWKEYQPRLGVLHGKAQSQRLVKIE